MKKCICSLFALLIACLGMTISVTAESNTDDPFMFTRFVNMNVDDYFGSCNASFDMNSDRLINGIDLTLMLRHKDDPEYSITDATIKKMESYLLGKENTLAVMKTEPYDVNADEAKAPEDRFTIIQELCSRDFRCVGAGHLEEKEELINVYFVGCDEYVLETIAIPFESEVTDNDILVVSNKLFQIVYSEAKGFRIAYLYENSETVLGNAVIAFNLIGYDQTVIEPDIFEVENLLTKATNISYDGDTWSFTVDDYLDVIIKAHSVINNDYDKEYTMSGLYLISEDNEYRILWIK